MEYCFTTNIDIWETFKGFTPYIMGIVVYWIWHKQKEKEVIANEANEILKITDDLKLSYTMTYLHYHTNINNSGIFNYDDFKESIDKEHRIREEFTLKIQFLLTVIEDNEISKIYKNYRLNEAKFSTIPIIYENKNTELVEALRIIDQRLEEDLKALKLKLAKYAMYKNKIIFPKRV